ncbi:MAG: alpha/beta hydrolase [Chroococcales cyanobacterium]
MTQFYWFSFLKQGSIVAAGLTGMAYLTICLILYIAQNRIIFKPTDVIETTPSALGLVYEELWLPVPTLTGKVERIHGWWLPATSQSKGVLLYFHGNGENIGANLDHAKRFQALGFSVLLIDYRGYGRSEGGFPSEAKVYEDGEVAWNYLLKQRKVNAQDIFIYGHSLGGAIAIELATRHPDAAGLIVESSFTSIREMAGYAKIYEFFPIEMILHQKFDSVSKIPQLKMPLLIIHGTEDTVVPALMSQVLFDTALVPKKLFIVPDADHNDVASVSGTAYLETIKEFYQLVRNLNRVRRSEFGVKKSMS